MTLHNDPKAFDQVIRLASEKLNINPVFIEKDYWITLLLKRLSESKYAHQVVFKGGTSLSKGHHLISRFSEDVDLAVISEDGQSANKIKTLIRTVEKELTQGLKEQYIDGQTSKGSRFRKSLFKYNTNLKGNTSNRVIIEINSFANPFPYAQHAIHAFIADYFRESGNERFIGEYGMDSFEVNVLDKKQTVIEKLVSLIRFSFSDIPIDGIRSKIRHFYDLHHLLQDEECNGFIMSEAFQDEFNKLLEHDKLQFDDPTGWKEKALTDSILMSDFDGVWKQVKQQYNSELGKLAFRAIPEEQEVYDSFKTILKKLS
ncbi:nucleotidyl transferase AbiEii/AbiGii toxin family protein [Marinilabilia salmonicolor]|uniref:nucleotidyl transferase AbiEii/AbiGii toxin family protein n=1 Tax=Marinilabilia salmonicolor TaxID=989 RepID=UPI00029B4F30|nr:nucleotidyl transferase AbiEii/AbiGii toxin family protein [Marinilabilia salmonicolor]